jgi:AcrR family transcriptional regulator
MRDGSKTRLRIDQTAMRLFVEKGITETTVRDIAAEANIAEGTLYRHYPSKEELAWRLFVDNFTAIGRTLAEIQRSQDGIRNKLSAIIRYFCSVFDRDAVMFNYLFLARHQHMLRLTPRMSRGYEPGRDPESRPRSCDVYGDGRDPAADRYAIDRAAPGSRRLESCRCHHRGGVSNIRVLKILVKK